MGVEGLSFDHERHIAQVWVIQHGGDALKKARLALWLKVPFRARICVQLVDILKVVLAIAAANYVQFGADESH